MSTSMSTRRLWIAGGAATAVVIVAAGWFSLIGPKLSSASDHRSETESVQVQNDTLQSQVSKLEHENEKIDELTLKLQKAINALPPESGLPSFSRQLALEAKLSGVDITSISVGAIVPANGQDPAVTEPTDGTTDNAAGNLYAIPVTVVSTGSAIHQMTFVGSIQVGPRRALVTSTQFAPAGETEGGSITRSSTVTTQLTIFSAPLSPEELAQLKKLLRGDVSDS